MQQRDCTGMKAHGGGIVQAVPLGQYLRSA
jgi:hypothetical protein